MALESLTESRTTVAARVASGASARVVDLPDLLAEPLRRVAGPVVPGVPDIPGRQRGGKDARAGGRDPQRRAARRAGEEHRVASVWEPSFERDTLAVEEPSHDLEALLES